MYFSKSTQLNFFKFLSLFSIVRGYNIIVLVLAQYLTAKYILSSSQNWISILLDIKLFCIVFASAASTSGGYIINNFYDSSKDQINRPTKYLLEHLVSQKLQLVIYFLLNSLVIILASVISFKVVLFFTIYIFSIFIYSNTIKRLFWVSNLFSAILMIFPFLAITLYFKNFENIIFYHAGFLFFLILARDIIKDLESFKGDWVQRYRTLPVVYNNYITKLIISTCLIFSFAPIYLLSIEDLGLMNYYLILSVPYLMVLIIIIWISENQKMYLWCHNLIKLWILLGVLSITLINKNFI
jgi:4-hydroxybenzoate polyprenyltransferase